MSDIVQKNVEILRRRWPEFAATVLDSQPPADLQWEGLEASPTLSVNGLRLWSAYDSEAEARLQATTMIPEDAKTACVYGVGSGDLIRELLKRNTIRRVTVVPLNRGLFHLLLHVLDCTDWLDNPRVNVEDPKAQRAVQNPLAVVPPCLDLADPEIRELKDHLTQELIRPYEQERQARRTPMRRAHIEANRSFIESDGDVSDVFGSAPGCTAYVCAAGPTLTKTAPWISQHRRAGLLIAVDGALLPLLELGLIPDYVVSIDDNPKTIKRYFDADLSACEGSTLVYSPIVDHAAIVRWPGKRLTMYTEEGIYDELRECCPKANLFVGGSVIHPAVDLAVQAGAASVSLFGADFGFPDGQVHANEMGPVNTYTNAAQFGTTARNGIGKSIATTISFNGYRLSLEYYLSHHPEVQFINSSRSGARIAGARYRDDSRSVNPCS